MGLRHKDNPLETCEENLPMELTKPPRVWN